MKKNKHKTLVHLVFVFFFFNDTLGLSQSCLLLVLDSFFTDAFFPHLLSPYTLFGRNCPLGRAVKFFQKQIHLVCSPSLKSNIPAIPSQSCSAVATQVKHKAGGGEGRGRDQVLLELFCLLVHLCVGRNWSPTDQYSACDGEFPQTLSLSKIP